MTIGVRPLCAAVLLCAAACDETPPTATFPESIDAALRRSIGPWGVVPIAPMPQQNPALIALGRALMFDKILSGNRDISCATCHEPALHATDGLALAIGTGGIFFFSSRRRHTRLTCDWSSDVCSSDLSHRHVRPAPREFGPEV